MIWWRSKSGLSGTSPRTRGKRRRRRGSGRGAGNIPAHAGKTISIISATRGGAEHPRARGENSGTRWVMCAARGTSPRTRGKLHFFALKFDNGRNIPAHAGKTIPRLQRPRAPQEHPRARGENPRRWGPGLRRGGTSPRTRGKPAKRFGHPQRLGNIPAHAGKTSAMASQYEASREHPRARGENPNLLAEFLFQPGTSPRTRGKREASAHYQVETGNIPAHAGKTIRSRPCLKSWTEHPRARGENITIYVLSGKPPWNIPAHAGKTPFFFAGFKL